MNEWLDSITSDTQGKIAELSGIPRRTLQYQVKNGPQMDTIIAIAEAYEKNPLVAFVELDMVDAHWLEDLVGDVDAALLAASPEQVANLVLMRIRENEAEGKVTELEMPLDELAMRRPQEAALLEDDLEPERYVAKRKRPEPAEGDDDYGSGA